MLFPFLSLLLEFISIMGSRYIFFMAWICFLFFDLKLDVHLDTQHACFANLDLEYARLCLNDDWNGY